jgi:protein subunit release factor A
MTERVTEAEALLSLARGWRSPVMSNVIVEIRAAEGGDDAKLIVKEQFAIYSRLCSRRGL